MTYVPWLIKCWAREKKALGFKSNPGDKRFRSVDWRQLRQVAGGGNGCKSGLCSSDYVWLCGDPEKQGSTFDDIRVQRTSVTSISHYCASKRACLVDRQQPEMLSSPSRRIRASRLLSAFSSTAILLQTCHADEESVACAWALSVSLLSGNNALLVKGVGQPA
jgi:hypothetical protein